MEGNDHIGILTAAWAIDGGAGMGIRRSNWRFCHVRDDDSLDLWGGGEDVEKWMDSRR